MTDPTNELRGVAETARRLNRSTEQVRRYLREGSLSGRRLGGQWFINQSDIDSFLARRGDGSALGRHLAAANRDPLRDAIALGGSGGGDVAGGRYRVLYAPAERREG